MLNMPIIHYALVAVMWNGLATTRITTWNGGTYTMKLSYVTGENRSVYCKVNGNEEFEIKTPGNNKKKVKTVSRLIHLKKGMNTIRLGNPDAWCPDIDKISIIK